MGRGLGNGSGDAINKSDSVSRSVPDAIYAQVGDGVDGLRHRVDRVHRQVGHRVDGLRNNVDARHCRVYTANRRKTNKLPLLLSSLRQKRIQITLKYFLNIVGFATLS